MKIKNATKAQVTSSKRIEKNLIEPVLFWRGKCNFGFNKKRTSFNSEGVKRTDGV